MPMRRATMKEVAQILGVGRRRVARFIKSYPEHERASVLFFLMKRAEEGETNLIPDARKQDVR